jgi:glycosyltransferase involved in cell wall biosynthesis
MESIFLSVVIPARNEERNLPVLLGALEKQTDKDFEVIVVDSNSKDRTKEVALSFAGKIPNFRFFQGDLKNVSQARNFGATKAKGEFLIFFDADVEPADDFIATIKEKILKYQLDATTVWNRAKKGWKNKFIFGLLNFSMSLFQKIKPAANGPCIIVRKSIFEKIGRFDEEIVFGEDFELIQRMVKKTKARFAVFSRPILYVSTRRFEKEGLIKSLSKSIKALFYQLFFGPIKEPIFEYQMGGDYYQNKKEQK